MPPKWQSTSSSLLLLHKQKPVILEYPWRAPLASDGVGRYLPRFVVILNMFCFWRSELKLPWAEVTILEADTGFDKYDEGIEWWVGHREILGGSGWYFYEILLTSQRDELQSKIAGAAASSQRQPKARPPEVGGLVWRERTSREFTSTWLVSNPFNPLQSWGKFFEPAVSFCNPFDFWHMLIKRVPLQQLTVKVDVRMSTQASSPKQFRGLLWLGRILLIELLHSASCSVRSLA